MENDNKIQLFFEKQPFAVRLTNDDMILFRENFDELFDGDQSIQPRKAFVLLGEKALIKINKNKEGLPADKQLIADLEKELAELKSKQNELTHQFNSCVELKADLENKLDQANAQIELLSKQTEGSPEMQVLQAENIRLQTELSKPFELTQNQRLLNLNPFESFILRQIEQKHETDAKGILIDRFFNVYQERGNGDFDILRIAPGKMKELKALYSSK